MQEDIKSVTNYQSYFYYLVIRCYKVASNLQNAVWSYRVYRGSVTKQRYFEQVKMERDKTNQNHYQ